MNYVLKNDRAEGGYYIVSVIRDDGMYLVRTKRIDQHGNVLVWNNVSGDGFATARFATLEQAKERAKTLASIKRKKGMRDVILDTLPDPVKAKLAAPIETQVDVTQLLAFVQSYRKERYVTFIDTVGLEDNFDLGIEYVGNMVDDPTMMEVYDKFGHKQMVRRERLASVVKTEQCLEAEGVKA